MIVGLSLVLAAITLSATAWLVLHTNRADRLEHAEAELREAQAILERLIRERRKGRDQ